MHPQIKEVIKTISVNPDKSISLSMTVPVASHLGAIIGRLYYESDVMSLLTPGAERSGMPNYGYQHTLDIRCSARDAVTFVETMKEEAIDLELATHEGERQVVWELSYISQEILLRKNMQ